MSVTNDRQMANCAIEKRVGIHGIVMLQEAILFL